MREPPERRPAPPHGGPSGRDRRRSTDPHAAPMGTAMTTVADVRRIAAALPDVEVSADGLIFAVRRGAKSRGFAWAWRERVAPKRARVPNPGVFAVRVATVAQRDLMIAAEPAKFFPEPHYDGFPAVLVRLDAVSAADLDVLLAAAWRFQAEPPRRSR